MSKKKTRICERLGVDWSSCTGTANYHSIKAGLFSCHIFQCAPPLTDTCQGMNERLNRAFQITCTWIKYYFSKSEKISSICSRDTQTPTHSTKNRWKLRHHECPLTCLISIILISPFCCNVDNFCLSMYIFEDSLKLLLSSLVDVYRLTKSQQQNGVGWKLYLVLGLVQSSRKILFTLRNLYYLQE